MNKRISLGAAIAVMIIVATLTFSITRVQTLNDFNTRVNDLKEREQEFEKFAEIDRVVRTSYLNNIDDTQLMDSVAQGYLQGISDKYAMYISAEEYKKLTQAEEEKVVGIGALIEQAPDEFFLEVKEVYSDSPAQVAGIEAGDLIIKIDDVDLTRENSTQMLESINGPQGSKITVVVRRGSEDLDPMEMIRRSVPIPTVESHMMEQAVPEDPKVGYIRIIEFGERTYDQFNRELQRLMDNGVEALIFDVRDNKGGTLRSATRILDKLLPDGVLVTATDKAGNTEVVAYSDANQVNLPMTVLVNNGTASAAELFAQSIKDYEKGSIVGVTTQGKGVMQEIFPLSDGSAINLTVAFYQPKSGINFNEVGIKPDFEVKMEGDWIELDDSLDSQRAKAKEVAISLLRQSEALKNSVAEGESGEEPGSPEESSDAESGAGGSEASSEASSGSESSSESSSSESGSSESSEGSGDSREEESESSEDEDGAEESDSSDENA